MEYSVGVSVCSPLNCAGGNASRKMIHLHFQGNKIGMNGDNVYIHIINMFERLFTSKAIVELLLI